MNDNLETPPGLAIIPGRSREEAMDWALVLISQGIETTVIHLEEEPRWGLLISEGQESLARRIIELYVAENRKWSPPFKDASQERLLNWNCPLWALYLVMIFAIDLQKNYGLRESGMMSSQAVVSGEWWRLFTAVSLHADVDHLVSNLISGTLLLGLAMARFGPGNAILAGWLSGAAGNLAGYFVYDASHRGLGASGMVFGLLGLLSTFSIVMVRQHRKLQRHFFTSLFAGAMLFVLMGLNPATDVIAHGGGFVSGCSLGAVMTLQEKRFAPKSTMNLISAIVFMFGLAVTWWFALAS